MLQIMTKTIDLKFSDHFPLSSKQKDWQIKAAEFASQVSVDSIIEADQNNIFPYPLFEKACQTGFGSLPFKPGYGGQDGDYVSFALVNEVMARKSIPIMSSLGVHVLCQEPIYSFGTVSQKEKYLIPSACGKFLGAFGLTEPMAGSDTANIQTQAKPVDNGYLLNGSKVFITSGASAHYYIVMARLNINTSEAIPKDTITAFIVEANSNGLSIGQKFDMLGMRGYSTCELVFSDCFVPVNNLLGLPYQGRKVALSSLAKGRITIASQAVGWAYGALDAVNAYFNRHPQSLKKSHYEQIGKLVSLSLSAKVKTLEAARLVDSGNLSVKDSSIAKWHATDIAMQVASEAMNIIGLHSQDKQLLLEKIYRDAKAGQIYEGTNQIQRMLVGKYLNSPSI